jgi:hypothetical protein
VAENWKFDSNGFLFKNSSKHMQEILFCSSHRIEQNDENEI